MFFQWGVLGESYEDLGTLSVTYAPADSSDGVGFADVDKHQRHCH